MSKRVKNKLKNSLNTSQIKKIKHSKWTPKEDEKLKYLAKLNNYKNWKQISNQIKGRTAVQCQQRWNKILQPGLVKGPWSAYEDKILIEWVNKYGPIKWTLCSNNIPGRTGKQCREHWNNVLNNDIKKGEWTIEEDFLIMNFYKKYNGSWKKLIEIFDKRTENSIKNRFFSQLRKIACDDVESKERRNSAKIKLNTLLKYLDKAIIFTTNKFKKENNMDDKDIKNYIEKYDKKSNYNKNDNNYNEDKNNNKENINEDKNNNNEKENNNEKNDNEKENDNEKNDNNDNKNNNIKSISKKNSFSKKKIFGKKSSRINISENKNNLNINDINNINEEIKKEDINNIKNLNSSNSIFIKSTTDSKLTRMSSFMSTNKDNNKKFPFEFDENGMENILKRKNTKILNPYFKQNYLNNNFENNNNNNNFDDSEYSSEHEIKNNNIINELDDHENLTKKQEFIFMSKPSNIGGNGMNIVLPNDEK